VQVKQVQVKHVQAKHVSRWRKCQLFDVMSKVKHARGVGGVGMQGVGSVGMRGRRWLAQ
jgi:hypothetical protein